MRKKKKIQIIISISILIFVTIFIIYKNSINSEKQAQDDFIFFKFLNQEQNQEEKINKKTNEYKLKISKGTTKIENINLLRTVDQKTLINEKVAPGTKGSFDIILISDIDLEYKIEIIGRNQKPKNLKFSIEKEQEGEIRKNETKTIKINWEWCYEINKNEDMQDTKDGENIKKYNFEILVTGKEKRR